MRKKILIVFSLLLLTSCFNNSTGDINNSTGDINNSTGDINNSTGDINNSTGDINNDNVDVDINRIFTEENMIFFTPNSIEKIFLNDEILGDNMKNIDLEDFNNMKLLKSKGQEIGNNIIIKGKILDIIFQNLIIVKAYVENDLSICDKIDYMDGNGNSIADYCKADFQLLKFFANRDIKICNNFNEYFKGLSFMGIDGKPKDICIKLHGLLTEKDLTEEKIEDNLKVIFKTNKLDENILGIFNIILLKDKTCDNVDVLSMKIKCLNFQHEGNIFNNFKKEIYPQLINTKYLSDK